MAGGPSAVSSRKHNTRASILRSRTRAMLKIDAEQAAAIVVKGKKAAITDKGKGVKISGQPQPPRGGIPVDVQLKSMKIALDRLKNENRELLKSNEDLFTKNVVMGKEVNELKQNMDKAQLASSAIAAQANKLKEENILLKKNNTASGSNSNDVQADLVESLKVTENRLAEMVTKVDKLTAKLEVANQRIEVLETDNNKLKNELSVRGAHTTNVEESNTKETRTEGDFSEIDRLVADSVKLVTDYAGLTEEDATAIHKVAGTKKRKEPEVIEPSSLIKRMKDNQRGKEKVEEKAIVADDTGKKHVTFQETKKSERTTTKKPITDKGKAPVTRSSIVGNESGVQQIVKDKEWVTYRKKRGPGRTTARDVKKHVKKTSLSAVKTVADRKGSNK